MNLYSMIKILTRNLSLVVETSKCAFSTHQTCLAKKPSFNFSGYDSTQIELLKEECIEVNNKDQVVGSRSKMDCHLLELGPPLHRAFSLFIFNSKHELLMQKRANSKITFPGYFTNTCCSHPLFTQHEMFADNAVGVKRAAQRRTNYELGVPEDQLPVSEIDYITRIHYKAACGKTWGEHEIDYVLISQQDVELNVNENEVSQVEWVPLTEFDNFLQECKESNVPLTPWFLLIARTHLLEWWKNLDNIHRYYDHKTIYSY